MGLLRDRYEKRKPKRFIPQVRDKDAEQLIVLGEAILDGLDELLSKRSEEDNVVKPDRSKRGYY